MAEVTESLTVKPKREKRSYSKEYIATALNVLETHNGNVLGAAKELGIPRLTLREWAIKGRRVDAEVQDIQREKAPIAAALYDDTAALYLNHARDPFVISASSGLEAVKAAAICTDKSQLLQGLPTGIVANIERQELSVTLRSTLDDLLRESESSDPLDQARNITPDRPQSVVVSHG